MQPMTKVAAARCCLASAVGWQWRAVLRPSVAAWSASDPRPRASCAGRDARGLGTGCRLACSADSTIALLDLPSPSMVRQLAGSPEGPASRVTGFNAALERTSADPLRWWGFELNITTRPGGDQEATVAIASQQSPNRSALLASKWGPLHFVSVSTGVQKASANLLRSAAYLDPAIPGGHRWTVVDAVKSSLTGIAPAYDCVRRAALAGNALGYDTFQPRATDIVVFVHDDVHLLSNFEEAIYEQVERLHAQQRRSSWCAIAMAGGSATSGGLAGQWLDFGMLPYFFPMGQPADVVRLLPDEALIVTLRGSRALFDPKFDGFHCYGADLGLSCMADGQFVHLTDTFVASHKPWNAQGKRLQYEPDFANWWAAVDQDALRASASFVKAKWKWFLDLSPLATTACPLKSV